MNLFLSVRDKLRYNTCAYLRIIFLHSMSVFTASLSSESLAKASFDHPFIQLINDDKLTHEQFQTWRDQDYLFVMTFVRLVGRTLSQAPRQDFHLLIESLSTISQELAWFEKQIRAEGKNPDEIHTLPSNAVYQHYLIELMESQKNYFQLLVAFYAIEICYYETWKAVKNVHYREYHERWGSSSFGEYIARFTDALNRVSLNATEEERVEARRIWDIIMVHEVNFWNMTLHLSSDNR